MQMTVIWRLWEFQENSVGKILNNFTKSKPSVAWLIHVINVLLFVLFLIQVTHMIIRKILNDDVA